SGRSNPGGHSYRAQAQWRQRPTWLSLARDYCSPRWSARGAGGSLDHLIRPRQQRGRDRQPEGLGSLEVDDQLELRGLLDGQVARLGTFQNLVHIRGGAPVQVGNVHAVRHKPPSLYKIALVVHDGKPLLYRKFCNLCSLRTKDGTV